MESSLHLEKPAYIAGDVISGRVDITCSSRTVVSDLDIKLVGEGITQFFRAKFRAQKLCEYKVATVELSECVVERGLRWSVPFSIQLSNSLISTFDSGKKGRVRYYISWAIKNAAGSVERNGEEVCIFAYKQFECLPQRDTCGTNKENEEYDLAKMELFTPVSTYLAGELIQFRAEITNNCKKPLKKLAVLLLQNVVFFKAENNSRGRTRSYLMSYKEKLVNMKQSETMDWTDEIQIPDPVAPSSAGFHQTFYELVLIAINKGKKSNIRALFDQARYHFDLEKYEDDYFRDFIPHASCYIYIASLHGDIRSPFMHGRAKVPSLDEQWRLTFSEEKTTSTIPKTQSEARMARWTVNS